MKVCDVIVPIYNAFNEARKCIESVILSTDLTNHRLVLINDCSTDSRIASFLDGLNDYYPKLNIIVKHNKENLGFVKTVNIGMSLSNNDVLLLNSDTEVSDRWLEKIIKCAYSQENCATVTPLSNNATHVSVPKFMKPSPYDKYDLRMLNSIAEKICQDCPPLQYIELPTAHGFCMYIKREAIDEVGLFDDVEFEKGYGEENDFCFRANNLGYCHLATCDTIVFHKESSSFGSEKNQYAVEHWKKVYKRHYFECKNIECWCSQNFLSPYIAKYIAGLMNSNDKPTIMNVVSGFEDEKNDITLHVLDIINGLHENFNFAIFFRSTFFECYALQLLCDGEKQTIYFSFDNNHQKAEYFNFEYRKLVKAIFEFITVDILHIHHLKSHYFDIIDIANQHDCTKIISLHDFYCLCPTINMVDNDFNCSLSDKDMKCDNCDNKIFDSGRVVAKWRKVWYENLEKFDYVVTPSNNTKNHILNFYSDLKIITIEHEDNNKEKSKSRIDAIQQNKVKTIKVMCDDYRELYTRNIVNNNSPCINHYGKIDLYVNCSYYFKNEVWLMHTSLLYSNDETFDSNRVIQKTTAAYEGKFKVSFDIENIDARNFRFDPDEYLLLKIKDLKICVDGKEVAYSYYGSGYHENNTWYCLNKDPQFRFTADRDISKIEVSGSVAPIIGRLQDSCFQKASKKFIQQQVTAQ